MTKLAEQGAGVAISPSLMAPNLAQDTIEQVQARVDLFEQTSYAREGRTEELDAGSDSSKLFAQSELGLHAVQVFDCELANHLGLPLVVAFRLKNARKLLRLED